MTQANNADCGRRMEELSAYLDSGVSPDAAHIDHCPECQARLAGLRSLNAVARDLFRHDVERADGNEAWLENILANLQLETRAGRPIPIAGSSDEELSATEGSVIALIRAVGDGLGGLLIGRCRLIGDITIPGEPIRVEINVSARYGEPLQQTAQALRTEVLKELDMHTELNIAAVDISIVDLEPAVLPGAGVRSGQ